MSNHHTYVRLGDRAKGPQLPSFCRTRRPITTTVRVSSLQQLLWLLLLVVFLQLNTILLVLAGPGPAPLVQLAVPENIPMVTGPLAVPAMKNTSALDPALLEVLREER
ncbi:MAG: hypothetical protein WCF98_06535 [Synechococcus sp. ELA057]